MATDGDPALNGAKKPQGLSVRVVVRVRPITQSDACKSCTSLVVEPDGQHVSLTPPDGTKAGHKYAFDAALPEATSQEDVYKAAGIQQLVQAAAAGYHATVFAYGQTGSGKTYTMEGFKYSTTAAAAAKGKAPSADFDNTPPQQLGVTPRAVHALFAALNASTERRYSVRCSYVQIYKEQAYDLLNPTSILMTPTGPAQQMQRQPGPAGQQQQGLPGALRMRWSKTDDFYLENLFKVECGSADEALSLFRSGVANKIVASHKLNAQSSRSHCVFTLYIDSSPLASPTEVISSRLTLVDLAGSERGSVVGATEGKLRDESVAINKSLFTLRQVITCLASNSSREAQAQAQAQVQAQGQAAGQQQQQQAKLPPYRDSKLTSLLKNSLGGTAMTLMLACVAPADTFFEENVSTLEYARQAARITNQVSLNEDAKTKLIRELRAEVAFLRQQLAAVQAPGAVVASLGIGAVPAQGTGPGGGPGPLGPAPATSSQQPQQGNGAGGARPSPQGTPSARSSPGQAPGPAPAPRAPGGGGPSPSPPQPGLEELKQRLLDSAQHDIGIMVTKLLDAIGLVQSLSAVNQQLRSAYDSVSKHSEDLRIENDSLMIENAAVRDRLSFIEGVAGMSTSGKGPGPGGAPDDVAGAAPACAPAVYTAGAAALIELQELRRENALLRERVKGPGPGGAGPGPGGGMAGAGGPAGSQPGGPNSNGRFAKRGPPGGANVGPGGRPSAVAAPLTPFTPAVLRQVVSPSRTMPPPGPSAPGPASSRPPAQGPGAAGAPAPRRLSDTQVGASSVLSQALPSSPSLQSQGVLGSGSTAGAAAAAVSAQLPLRSKQLAGALAIDPPSSPHAIARSLSIEGGLSSVGAGPSPAADWSGAGASVEEHGAKLAQLMSVRNAMSRARLLAPPSPAMSGAAGLAGASGLSSPGHMTSLMPG